MSQVDELDMETKMLETEDYMLEVRLRIGDLEAQHRTAVKINPFPSMSKVQILLVLAIIGCNFVIF
jgi:hypothetical protein